MSKKQKQEGVSQNESEAVEQRTYASSGDPNNPNTPFNPNDPNNSGDPNEKPVNARIVEIIAEVAAVPEYMVVGDASFVNDLGMDSLALYELIVALEGEFDIEIPDADAEKNHNRYPGN